MSHYKNPRNDLKKNYRKIFNSSLIMSLFIIIAAFKFTPRLKIENTYVEVPWEPVTTKDIPQTNQNKLIPPPPKPIVPIEAPIDTDLPDVEIDETDLNPDAGVVRKADIFVDNEPGEQDIYFVAVEEEPSIIGELNLVYPELALRANIQGTVYVYAYIDETGNITRTELLKGIGGGCDEAALEAVANTKFKPGRQRGRPVKVKVTVPVKFIIN